MLVRTFTSLAVAICSVTAIACGGGQDDAEAASKLALTKVGSFNDPVYVTGAPGDTRRVFVVERGGRVRVIRGGKVLSRAFLDIRSKVMDDGGESGLLSIAFAPDYVKSKRFYVYHTGRDGRQNVVEYRRSSADVANPSSARLVMRMADPESNHNGGQLQFGPDKLLYIGTGDGGGANDQHGARGNAQLLSSPLGKLLRIDPRTKRRQGLRDPVVQSLRDAGRRARRDLQLRPAQPVALQLRPLDRRSGDR